MTGKMAYIFSVARGEVVHAHYSGPVGNQGVA
jgi:hypothetical protein